MKYLKILPIQKQLHLKDIRVVVVLVRNGESEDQAWRRHLTENPHDNQADIKIFHLAWPLD